MNKKFLRDQMQRLETNYGRDKFVISKELFDLWNGMFEGCNEVGFRQAVDKCIAENEYAPNVAGVMKHYKAIEEAHNELETTVKEQYTKIRTVWGEDYDSDTFKAIAEYIMRFPSNMRKVEMIELTQKAMSFSYSCDAVGRIDKPTIKEYLQGAR